MPSKNDIFKQYKFDITISELEYNKQKNFTSSYLKLALKGNDINCKIVNALRRISIMDVPSYAFPPELINITENSSVAFNRDQMKLRLSMLPVYGVNTDIFYLHENYWNKINFADPTRNKHESEKLVDLYINSVNDSNNIKSVTTDDITMYVDGEQISPYVYSPILLIKLKPNDTFKCHMRATLGIGQLHAIWRTARNAFYEQICNNKINEEDEDKCYDEENYTYHFTIEGNNQIDEYTILIRACMFLMKKLEDIKKEIKSRIDAKSLEEKETLKIELDGEDHTIGELLNYEFQNHKNILSSGCSKPDNLIQSISLCVTCDRHLKSPIDAILECIDITYKKISHIGHVMSNISEKAKK